MKIYINNHSVKTCPQRDRPNQWQKYDSHNFLASKRLTETRKRNCHQEHTIMKLCSQVLDHQMSIQLSDKSKQNQIKQFAVTLLKTMQISLARVSSAVIRALWDKNKSMSSKPETSDHIRAVIGSITNSRAQWVSQARNKQQPWIICRTSYPKSKHHLWSETPTKLLNRANSWACHPPRHTRFR